MSFNKNSSSSSSSSTLSVTDELTSCVDTSPESFDEEDLTCRLQWIIKRQLLLDKISDLECRGQKRQGDFQSLLERFNNIQKSLEWEIEKVQNSMVSTEQLEGLQKTFDEFQTIMQHNISRLRDTFQKTREVAAKQRANMKTQDKPRKEDLHPKLVKSIQSLKCCPTVPEMKANSKAVSECSSNLISVLNNITKSNTCSPATSLALKITTATIENLNKAFQDHCKAVEGLKLLPQKQRKVAEEVDQDFNVSSGQQYGSTVQQQVSKFPAKLPKRSKNDAVSKRLTLPQVKDPVLERTPDLQNPSADDRFPPAPALSSITRSVEKTKVSMESMEETRKVTSFEEMAQEELQSPAPLGIHHPSPVQSSDLPQIPQSVEERKAYVESMLKTGTSFEEMTQKDLQSRSTLNINRSSPVQSFDLPRISQFVEATKAYVESKLSTGTSFEEMAQKDLQSPSTLNIHRPSPVNSFELPRIPQFVEETKAYVESKLSTGTSFEEMAQKDLQSLSTMNTHRPSPVKSFHLPRISQSVEETKVDVVPVEDLQSRSPAHTHPSSIMKRPQIQTEVKPSLQTPDKPETNKYVSAVSGNTEKQYIKNSEDPDDKLLHERVKGQAFVIDIEAQENNLKHLDRSFQDNNISSQMYNLCRGNISQALQSVDLRLGCLLRRYIRHVQLKQLGKTLNKNFKLTRNFKDGLAFKKVHSQLCKFDLFQQSVRKLWDAKQASTDETRRWCIARMAHLYQQMNSIHGLHLTGISCVQRHVPLPLLTVTPVRFRTRLQPSLPQRPQTALSRASPARLPQNNQRAPHSTDADRKISASFLKISRICYSWPVSSIVWEG